MDCLMSMMTSQALEDLLWIPSLKIPKWRNRMSPPFEPSMICTKSRMTHPCVGIVLSFVFSGTRRSTTIRGMDEFLVLLSLDMMYPQIVFHCIDDDMMNIDGETMFRSSVGDLVLLVVRLVSVKKLTL